MGGELERRKGTERRDREILSSHILACTTLVP